MDDLIRIGAGSGGKNSEHRFRKKKRRETFEAKEWRV